MGEEKLTEEQMEKINWLNRAFYADNMIKALEAIRERNKSIAERCTASYDSNGSSGSYANSQETIIHTICDDNIRIQKQLDELIICRAEIKEAIEGIGNAELVTIMNMRYLAYMKPYQIAEALHYDRKTIQRKHKTALDLIRCP